MDKALKHKHASCKTSHYVETPEITRALDVRLSERYREFADLYSSARKKLSPDTVHDLRSSSRRLIAALEFFEPLEIPVNTVKARRELKTLLHSLGELRNLQVGREKVKTEAPSKEFLKALKTQERHEKKVARRALKAFEPGFVRKQVHRLCEYLEKAPKLEPVFEKSIHALRTDHLQTMHARVIEAAGLVPKKNPPPAAIHQVRIRFKQFRYAWEFLSPELKTSKGSEKTMRAFQDFLGEIQDLHVLLAMLVQYSPRELRPYAHSLARMEKSLIGRFHSVYPPVLSHFKVHATQVSK